MPLINPFRISVIRDYNLRGNNSSPHPVKYARQQNCLFGRVTDMRKGFLGKLSVKLASPLAKNILAQALINPNRVKKKLNTN